MASGSEAAKKAVKKATAGKAIAGKPAAGKAWSALSAISAVLASVAAKKFIDGSWRAATGKKPPANPADPDTETREAIVFAIFSGAVIALVKMLATRKAADYYLKSTGKQPTREL